MPTKFVTFAGGLFTPYPIGYTCRMITLRTLPRFDAWLSGLSDERTRFRLLARLRKAQLGNLGDTKPVGGGVFEMREHFGPGWRMYYVRRGTALILMLGGGDKSTQTADIQSAIQLAGTLEEDNDP